MLPRDEELAIVIAANEDHAFAVSTRPANISQTGPHFTAACSDQAWDPVAGYGLLMRNNVLGSVCMYCL